MKISVIMTSYNYAQYIEEAINSVINQTHPDWELIIVDDGSSDNSIEIIKSYCEKDSRIKLLQHENRENKGLKESILLGLEHAQGEWTAFLESDDFFEPDNLQRKVEIAEKYSNASLIFNKVNFLWEGKKQRINQHIFEKTQKKLSKISFPKNLFYYFDIDNSILTFSCVMVKANILRNADFNTPVDSLLDWWLWIHLAYENKFYYIDAELTNWRLHDKSYILEDKKPIWYFLQIKAYEDVYQKSDKKLNILAFIMYLKIKIFFIRGFRFIKKSPLRIKNYFCKKSKNTL